jgi:hypothetical protein
MRLQALVDVVRSRRRRRCRRMSSNASAPRRRTCRPCTRDAGGTAPTGAGLDAMSPLAVELPAPLAAVERLVDLVGIQLRAPPCHCRRRGRRALRDFRRRPAAVRGRRRAALTKCGLDCLGQLRHRATGGSPIAARTLSQLGFGDGAAVRRRSR